MKDLTSFDNNYDKILNSSAKIRAFLNELLDGDSLIEFDTFLAGKASENGADGLGEGVITGFAKIDDTYVCIIAHNAEVKSAGFSRTQALKIKKALDRAYDYGYPVLSVIDSAGFRLDDGIGAVEAFGEVLSAFSKCISLTVVKGSAVGLMSAYVAASDYVFVSEKDGYLSFNTPMSVTAKAGKMIAPTEEFGAKSLTAEGAATFSFKSTSDLKTQIAEVLSFEFEDDEIPFDDANRTAPLLNDSYTADAAFAALFDDGKFLELNAAYAPDVRTVYGKVDGKKVAVVATDATKNDGFTSLEGIKKVTAFLRTADNCDIPLITLLDSIGIANELEYEHKGLASEMSKLMSEMCAYEGRKYAFLAGNCVGSLYLAFAGRSLGFDCSIAFATASVTAVCPLVGVEFFYKDEIAASDDPVSTRTQLIPRFLSEYADPFKSAKDGYVDNIIEPAALRPYAAAFLKLLD